MARNAKLNAYLEMRGEVTGAVKAIKRTQAELDTLTKRMRNLQQRQSRLNRTMRRFGQNVVAQVSGIVAMGAALQQAAAAALEFDTNMAKVQFLVGVSANEMKELASGVREISSATGRSVVELSDGLFDIQSAGFRGAQSLEVLRRAADAAVLGLGTTKVMADAMTNALGAWGSENLTAADTVATLWAGVREGKAPAEAFATLVSDVGALAAQLGIELDQVVGAFAHLTRSMDEATARTRIKGILRTFLKPSEQAVKIMQQYGLTIKDVARAVEHDLLGALQMIRTALPDEVLGKLFRDAEGLAGLLTLTGSNYAGARAVSAGVSNTTTADFDRNVEGASNTIRNTWNRTMAPVMANFVELGEQVLPPVITAFGALLAPLDTALTIINAFNKDHQRDTVRDRNAVDSNVVSEEGHMIQTETRGLIGQRLAEQATARNLITRANNEAIRQAEKRERLAGQVRRDFDRVTRDMASLQNLVTLDAFGGEGFQQERLAVLGKRVGVQAKQNDKEQARVVEHRQAMVLAQAQGAFAGGEASAELLAQLQERVAMREQEAKVAQGVLEMDERANAVAQMRAGIDGQIASTQKEIRRAKFDIANATTDEQRRQAQLTLANLESQLHTLQAINLEAPEYRELFDEYAKWSKDIEQAAQAQERLQESLQRTEQLVDFGKNAAVDMFMAFTEGTMSAGDAMKRFASDVIRELYRVIVVQQTVNALAAALGFGGAVAAPTAAPSHGGAVYAVPRAFGGTVLAGQSYWVGEKRPEMFRPNESGAIDATAEGGTSVTNIFNIESTDGPGVRQALNEAMPQILEASKNYTANELSRHTGLRRRALGG